MTWWRVHELTARTQWRLAILIASLLIGIRSAVPLVMERSMDSDQAIVGLMAKHLAEFQTFPLFFYGQHYMLGVQAWIAAPFFWIGGPTVTMLRLPLLLVNIAMVAGVITLFARAGLRPLVALVAALPLIATTPIMSDAMLRPLGAAVEPFAWMILIWHLRSRPGWCGAVFCVAFLHREFAAYALPALLIAQWYERSVWRARQVMRAVIAFGAVWMVIDALKRVINVYGPPGGEFASASLALQPKQLLLWLSIDTYGARVLDFIVRAIPDMFGARAYQATDYYGIFSTLTVGSSAAGIALALGLILAAAGALRAFRRTASTASVRSGYAFAIFLIVIGVVTIFAYALNQITSPNATPVIRYALLVLFIPAGILAAFFLAQPSRLWSAAVMGTITIWATLTMVDAGRVIHEYRTSPPDNPHRVMADYLVEHDIRYARAQYWDAYIITFLARERVIIDSDGKMRISAYRARVEAHESEAVYLVRQPCASPRTVSAWCIE